MYQAACFHDTTSYFRVIPSRCMAPDVMQSSSWEGSHEEEEMGVDVAREEEDEEKWEV